MTAQQSDIDPRILKVLEGTLGAPAAEFTNESRFVEDHDGDSMADIEIAAKLEQEFGITIPDESLPRMVNLAGVREVVMETLAASLTGRGRIGVPETAQ